MKLPAVVSLSLVLSLAGCDSPFALELGECPQTYEFGSYGCARLVVFLEFPSQPWPDSRRFDLRVQSAQPDDEVLFLESKPTAGANLITVSRRFHPLRGTGDTISVWVRAAILEDPRPILVGVPLPVFASDSLFHIAQFSGVGTVPRVDTLYLTLRRP